MVALVGVESSQNARDLPADGYLDLGLHRAWPPDGATNLRCRHDHGSHRNRRKGTSSKQTGASDESQNQHDSTYHLAHCRFHLAWLPMMVVDRGPASTPWLSWRILA